MALRDNDRLRQEIARLEGALRQFRDLEGSLQEHADERAEGWPTTCARTRAGSRRASSREAEGRAEMILQKAQGRLEDIQREIDGLKNEAARGGIRHRSR